VLGAMGVTWSAAELAAERQAAVRGGGALRPAPLGLASARAFSAPNRSIGAARGSLWARKMPDDPCSRRAKPRATPRRIRRRPRRESLSRRRRVPRRAPASCRAATASPPRVVTLRRYARKRGRSEAEYDSAAIVQARRCRCRAGRRVRRRPCIGTRAPRNPVLQKPSGQCSDLLYEVHRSHRWKVHRNHRNGVPWHPLS
jgi:hypothetical protein